MTDARRLADWLLTRLVEDEQRICQETISTRQRAVRLGDCQLRQMVTKNCMAALDHSPVSAAPIATRTLQRIALDYADRPGYQESWRP